MNELEGAPPKRGRESDPPGPVDDAIAGLRTVLAAASLDSAGPTQIESLVATAERESRRVVKLLGERSRVAEAVAMARFPAIAARSNGKWNRWWKAVGETGEGSAEAQKARDAYLSALLNYDCELRCRLLDCEAMIRDSGRQERLCAELADLQKSVERACSAAVRAPAAGGVAAQRVLLRVQGVRAPTARLQKAHAKIVARATEELRRVERIKATNDTWISDLRARSLGDAVRKALKALGIAA